MEENRPIRKRDRIKKGFSKLLKEDKLRVVAEYIENPGEFIALLKSFWHQDKEKQRQFDEFSENTISNFHIPYGVSPNVIINDTPPRRRTEWAAPPSGNNAPHRKYHVPQSLSFATWRPPYG